ncbi:MULTISPECIES: aldehyde dehydrogenase [Oceanobacillus]|uniref:Aldehyde dehydrogenase n=1 Tax=Oceanobacillus kimchii TaxID=746691 RepID=A0ABQ5TLB0_9BACI|nr:MULTISPECIES: aldehyde dehydrogenase [Oceanobacillus]MBT2598393.1 aldehyde dehydrogenase [Oceanobacillus sp. ISL-74]MBT2651311.1 aldehyde dehydrogenase [Oceanobacillus sp. ISL-73]MCT1575970.1 aldehyde dehydrogenase [Oceanobacillus kimchii]MCT2135607.1 aldehyde dehydrogenase [Oceanobacillus kimchii]OEH55707.1 aldehyde dehydrogenase [Oceanobacillus sp. E9]
MELLERYQSIVENQRAYYNHGNTVDYSFRKQQLEKMKDMLKEYESHIFRALKHDLNKSKHEVITSELGILYSEIDNMLKNLRQWMQPDKVTNPITHKGSKSYIMKEPLGVILVIAPWNYPLQLSLAPVIGAIAAGNTVIIKPSEHAPHTSELIAEMVQNTFDSSFLTVVQGAKNETEALLKQRFDHIFFTGGAAIGKIVMRAASEFLTPVTLELGGKSPAIVDEDANIQVAAKRIVWGKYTNAGQTCVAPDYILVHEKAKFKLLKAMKKHIKSMYGKDPLQNEAYTRIIHEGHFDRLTNFLSNGTIVHGGEFNRDSLSIEPTILDKITWDEAIMKEEIFGPILPVLTYTNIEDALYQIKLKEKPLALYYFGENEKMQQQVMEYVSFGGGAINDTIYHLANPHLPFGGVGASGMGAYHGKASFDTFSHHKSIMKQTTKFDIPFRYPGGKISSNIVKKFLT